MLRTKDLVEKYIVRIISAEIFASGNHNVSIVCMYIVCELIHTHLKYDISKALSTTMASGLSQQVASREVCLMCDKCRYICLCKYAQTHSSDYIPKNLLTSMVIGLSRHITLFRVLIMCIFCRPRPGDVSIQLELKIR